MAASFQVEGAPRSAGRGLPGRTTGCVGRFDLEIGANSAWKSAKNRTRLQEVQALVQLDDTDRTLIARLQRNARIPSRTLADKAGISGAECVRRVRRLEATGVIRRYVTLIDPAAVGLHTVALIRVRLDRQTVDRMQAFEMAMQQRSEVLQCWQVSDTWNFELLVVTTDISALALFQRECFSGLGVVAVNVSIVVRQAKHRTDFQVEAREDVTPSLLGEAAGCEARVVHEAWPRSVARRL